MAKLKIKFGPPIPDFRIFQNNTVKMTNEEKVVLSLRGFASAVSMMIPTYHFWLAAIEVEVNANSALDYSNIVTHSYMRESMLDYLLIQVRRVLDPDRKSLAAGTIAELLDEPDMLRYLVRRSLDLAPAKEILDAQSVENHLRLVQQLCSLGIVNDVDKLAADAPLFQVQTYLLRRAANKRSAHMTFDDYGFSRSDICDVCFKILVIARALHRVCGDDVYLGNYADVDRGSYEASARILGHRHAAGLLTSDLEENIDMLVHRISSGNLK